MKRRLTQILMTTFLAPLLINISVAKQVIMPQRLPEPLSNNAVAMIESNNQMQLFSFMGLAKQKTWKDVHNRAYTWRADASKPWTSLPNVPSSLTLKGRLASIAATANNRIFIFGGYTVADDHTEISSPDNFEFITAKNTYQPIAATPVPTDDAIALSYQDRYIYLISGWHNDGNVNLVQVYDVKTNTWKQASPFLGKSVFGHAGGIIGNNMLICDGVSVDAHPNKRRTFSMVQACYSGAINADNPYKIDWRVVPHPTGSGRYRMASAGLVLNTENGNKEGVMFVGGSENPYNYNGIGYNKVPSSPSQQIWFYGFLEKKWFLATLRTATMDHRGLLVDQKKQTAYIIGGMGENQTVLDSVSKIDLRNLTLHQIK